MIGWLDSDPPGSRPGFHGIVLRGTPKSRGIFINYCPFCGVKMALPVKNAPKGDVSGDHSG